MVGSRFSSLSGRRRWFSAILTLAAILGGTRAGTVQNDENPTITGDAIIDHLDAAIGWERCLAGIDVGAGQPSDTLYLDNARNLGNQVVQFAFQSAEAESALLGNEKVGNGTATNNSSSTEGTSTQQNLARAAADATARIGQTQARIDELKKRIAAPHRMRQEALAAERDTLQHELELDKALQGALNKIVAFASSSENVSTGLQGKINNLKRSVPELTSANSNSSAAQKAVQSSTKASHPGSSGLFGQASTVFSQLGDLHDVDQILSQTSKLRDTADKLQAPLRSALKATIQQGRDAASRQASSDPDEAKAVQQNLAALTARFKQISDAAIPLRQEIILLDQGHADLQEWRDSVVKEYKRVLRSFLDRIFVIILALALVAAFSAVTRRAIYRYVRDARRRRQVLLLRRFVTGFLMFVVIALGFLSEFSSLATFAGFLTAGIAVALQTVILSLAAYFFLIGRYGVRVGDRVTVSGVTGDVIDIGLVRLYLMELAGTGIDLYPTGRVVVFSNSVMFQAAPFFKQLPGTSYTWHEVALGLSPDANVRMVEAELLKAVNSVFAEYESNIQRQYRMVEQLMDTQLSSPGPQSQLRLGEGGLEVVLRYPVELDHASEFDDRVTHKLVETISKSAALKDMVTGSPKLRSSLKAA